MDPAQITIESAAAAFRRREFTPLELTTTLLDRIDRLNPQLNAYLTVTRESALAEAQAATDEQAQGKQRGPLHGIPLSLKDLYHVAGVRTTAGSVIMSDFIATEDGAVVEKLKAGGAVLLGKTNMHEWALGITNVNPHFGPVHNPWNLDLVPGGSSGGSGAALAADLCLGSFGSDTGGSIRIPASLCGIVGLKPTSGRISVRGVVPLSWTLDHAGPLARTVRDAAILLQETAGYDPEDVTSIDVPVDDYLSRIEGGVGGMRVIVPDNFFFESSDQEVATIVEAAIAELERLGAKRSAVSLPGAERLGEQSGWMNVTDASTYHADHLRDRAADFGSDVLTRMRIGETKTGRDYAALRQEQRVWRRRLENTLAGEAVLAVPSTPTTAFPISGTEAVAAARRMTSLTAPFNFTGVPAISIPCGFTRAGLPVGLQLVARPWAEALLLQVARAYERATEWHKQRPVLN